MSNCNCKVKNYKEVHYSASTRYSFDLDRGMHGSCHVEVGPKLHKFIFAMELHLSTAFLRHKIIPDFLSGLWKCLSADICIFCRLYRSVRVVRQEIRNWRKLEILSGMKITTLLGQMKCTSFISIVHILCYSIVKEEVFLLSILYYIFISNSNIMFIQSLFSVSILPPVSQSHWIIV